MEAAVRYAVEFDTYDQTAFHTSAAVRGEPGGDWINSDGNRTSWMLEDIRDSCFDSVRETLRFAECVEQLKQYASQCSL